MFLLVPGIGGAIELFPGKKKLTYLNFEQYNFLYSVYTWFLDVIMGPLGFKASKLNERELCEKIIIIM